MIKIRRIVKGEADAYRNIRLRSLKDSPGAFASSYEDSLLRSAESWAEQADGMAEGPDRATFLVFRDGEIKGVAALYRDAKNSEVGEVTQVWLAPDERGGGASNALMDFVFTWAASNDFTSVRAAVTVSNVGALKFYKKYGFEESDEASCICSEAIVLSKRIMGEASH